MVLQRALFGYADFGGRARLCPLRLVRTHGFIRTDNETQCCGTAAGIGIN